MLNVSTDTIQRLIELAREFHAQEAVSIPEEPGSPADDWARQILADHMGDSSFAEFASIVKDLEPDQQQEVVALLWLGRGDFAEDEWQDALDQAADEWTPATASYLMAHPLLPSYLEDGLEALGYTPE